MIKKFKEVFGKTGDVMREYPMVLVMAFLAAISAIYYINYDFNSRDYSFFYLKFGLVAALGISVMYGLKMLSQRIGKEILLQLLGIIFLLFFYFLLPAKENQFTEVYAYLLIPTFILSHLLVSFIPFMGRKQELNFWQYNKNLFINIFLTGVFTGVLTGGIMLAILAVDNLFDFNFNGRYYSYTFNFLSIFGSCFIFLLFNEKGLIYLEKNGDYPVILKFFTQYVLVPLLLIYAVILYFYSAKILINWELPRGWVSYLILAYSVVGILAILLVHPLKEDSTKSWVRIFSKIFYYTLAPLIILLFVAIFTRILEYGFTEPRYFVLLLALWLTTVVLYFIFARKQTIKFVPMSLFIFGVFALAFPYFNAFSVAKRSQKKELMKTLADNKLLQSGQINFNQKVKRSVVNEIADKVAFLAKRKQQDFLQPLIDPKTQVKITSNIQKGNFYGIENIIQNNFKNVTVDDLANSAVATEDRLVTENFNANITGYNYLFKVYNYKNNSFTFGKNTLEIDRSGSEGINKKINLILNNQTISLNKEISQLFKKYPASGVTEVSDLSITKKVGNLELKIIFDDIMLLDSSATNFGYIINSESILILIKEN